MDAQIANIPSQTFHLFETIVKESSTRAFGELHLIQRATRLWIFTEDNELLILAYLLQVLGKRMRELLCIQNRVIGTAALLLVQGQRHFLYDRGKDIMCMKIANKGSNYFGTSCAVQATGLLKHFFSSQRNING